MRCRKNPRPICSSNARPGALPRRPARKGRPPLPDITMRSHAARGPPLLHSWLDLLTSIKEQAMPCNAVATAQAQVAEEPLRQYLIPANIEAPLTAYLKARSPA